MAQYIVLPPGRTPIEEDNPTILPKAKLREMKHTFLLRNPSQSVPSYWSLCVGNASHETGFTFYDPDEAGYHELRVLFDYVRKLTGNIPSLISAEDLIDKPEKTMKQYCRRVGMEFREDMLCWEPKTIQAFDSWKGFHDDAQHSTGFGKLLLPKDEEKDLPQVVVDTIRDNVPHFEYLLQFKIVV